MGMTKRISTLFITFAMMIAVILPVTAEAENREFDQFLKDEFVRLMEDDYLTMHFSVIDYESFGIEKPERITGDASWESFSDEVNRCDKALDALHQFDIETLSPQQKIEYQCYEFFLESARDLNKYPQCSGYFEPGSGIQDNLMTNFTEFVFRKPEDVRDYLDTLKTVPDYIADALRVTEKQAKDGYFMTDGMLDETQDAIEDFTSVREENPLIVIFEENIDAADFLSGEEKDACKKENRDIVLNSVIPAFESASTALEKLRGSRGFEGGLCNFKNGGSDYYSALVRYKTSSNQSVEDQVSFLRSFMVDLVNQYIDILMSQPMADAQYQDEVVEWDTPDEMLDYLMSQLDEYPEGPEVTYTCNYLDPSVASDTLMAYYMTPPVDNLRDNIIRINGDNVTEENSMFETLAHEGLPGHLYQFTYAMNGHQSNLRTALSFLGYSEGWAMYAEVQSWDRSHLSEESIALHKIYTTLSYVEDAAIDLGVNGLGWTVEDVRRFVDGIGLNGDSAPDLYDYVLSHPGLLLPYGYGIAKNLSLRAQAESELRSKFDAKAFNTVLLENGTVPFTIVEEQFMRYMLEATGKTPESSSAPVPSFAPAGTGQSSPIPLYIGLGVFAAVAIVSGAALHRLKRKDPLA